MVEIDDKPSDISLLDKVTAGKEVAGSADALILVTSLTAGGGSFKIAVTDTSLLLSFSPPETSVVFAVSDSLFVTEVDEGLREKV